MADLFDNPMGLNGFDFVEFASPQPDAVDALFKQLGLPMSPITVQKTWLYIAKVISTLS